MQRPSATADVGLLTPNERLSVLGAAKRASSRSLTVISDSRAEQSYTIQDTPAVGIVGAPQKSSIGFVTWLDALSNGSFAQIINTARAGRTAEFLATNNTSQSPRDTLQNAVIGPQTSDALIWLGTNDLGTYPGAQIAGRIQTIANAAKDSGKRVTVMCELPKNPAGGAWVAATQYELAKLNELLYRYSEQGQFLLVDATADFLDQAQLGSYQAINGAGTVGLYYDNFVHPNNLGGYVPGQAPGRALREAHPRNSSRSPLDTGSTTTPPTRRTRTSFPMACSMARPAGPRRPRSPGIVTGITYSVIASPNGIGNALAMDVTVNAGGGP